MEEIYSKLKPCATVKNIFLFLGAFMLAIIFWNFSKIWSFPDTAWPLTKGEKTKISSEVVQKFVTDRNGLARIEILFGDSDVSPGGTLAFKLLEEDCEKLVREVKLNITSLNSDNTTDFIFPKIDDSKGKTYCLKLSYTQKKGGKKANVFVAENPMTQNKHLSMNGEELTGRSLVMRPAYKNENLWQDFTELNKRMSQYKPWFLKHYFLDIIIFSFIILSVFLIIILIV